MQKAVYKNKDCQIQVCFHGDIANSVRVHRGKIYLDLSKLPINWMETFHFKKQMYAIVKIEEKYAQLFNVIRMHGQTSTQRSQAQTFRIKQ